MEALLTLLPLALKYVPMIAGFLGGPAAGTALTHVADAANKVFGTTDPKQIELQIQQDKSKEDMFKAELEARTEELRVQVEDLQNARSQTVQLAQAGSPIAWGAPIVSTIVLFGFVVTCSLLFFKPLTSENQLALLIVGAWVSGFLAVIQYWLGSSAGSKDKDALVATMARNSTASASQVVKDAVGGVKKMFR